MNLDPSHFDCFCKIYGKPPVQKPVGFAPSSYTHRPARSIPKKYWRGRLNRVDLRRICRDPTVDVLSAFSCTMAWGGQRHNHFRVAIKSHSLRQVLELLRAGLPRDVAFKLLNDLYRQKKLPGLGIAFFTKLIFFFSPSADGFILDQWTAKSAALLCTFPPIRLGGSGKYHFPATDTSGAEYLDFCKFVEHLTKQLNKRLKSWTNSQTEIALFGGKGTAWRKHVATHFQ